MYMLKTLANWTDLSSLRLGAAGVAEVVAGLCSNGDKALATAADMVCTEIGLEDIDLASYTMCFNLKTLSHGNHMTGGVAPHPSS